MLILSNPMPLQYIRHSWFRKKLKFKKNDYDYDESSIFGVAYIMRSENCDYGLEVVFSGKYNCLFFVNMLSVTEVERQNKMKIYKKSEIHFSCVVFAWNIHLMLLLTRKVGSKKHYV